jgi:hypothetical protein
MRLEELSQLKNPRTSSGIETAPQPNMLPRSPTIYTYRSILNKANKMLHSYANLFRKGLCVNEIGKIIKIQSDELLMGF